MVMKTFIFATCAALFAGGVVYFGTDAAETSGSAKIESVQTDSVDTGPKNIISRYIGEDDADEPSSDAVLEGNPYAVEASEEHPHPPLKIEEALNRKNDVVAKKDDGQITGTDVEEIELERQSEIVETEPAIKQREIVQTSSNLPQIQQTEADPRVAKRRKPTKRVQKRQLENLSDDPAQLRIDAVFEQAEIIMQPDLRDRAYLDLVDYATSKGMFGEAKKAAMKIQQIELRDTARSRIAMGLARFGKSDDAFALIEEVEIDELRDVMRVQVIEALLGADGRR